MSILHRSNQIPPILQISFHSSPFTLPTDKTGKFICVDIAADKPSTESTGASPRVPVIFQVVGRLDGSGAARLAIDNAIAVVKAGGRAAVASSGGPLVHELERGGVRDHVLPLDNESDFLKLSTRRRLRRLLAQENANIVHVYGWEAAKALRPLLGMQSTGNAGGAYNLQLRSRLTAEGDDFAAMLRKLGTGLLVTDLIGQGVNYVTGDYSRGASGFWVEKGEIRYPVEEITVAGNLSEMFRNIAGVGTDQVVRGSKISGSLLVEGMTVAGS